MDPNPVTVREESGVEEVIRLMRGHELPGVPVVHEGGRCDGIITEADLVIADEQGDLHLPHYIDLFGGLIPLEPLRRFEERLKKAFASKAADMMTEDPTTIEPDATIHQAARVISESGHNRLPVVEHGRYVGLVSRAEVLEHLAGL